MSDARRFEEVACEAARLGGKLLATRFRDGRPIEIEAKGLHDFVTRVDREAEAIVVEHLKGVFPEHTIMAEESAPDLQAAEYRWVIDPLDGTTNFIHGVPTFGVSVGFEGPDGLLAGAIHDPIRDETFHAARGAGARLNGEPIRCSEPDDRATSLIATGFPFRELSRLEPYMRAFEAFVRTTSGMRRAGAASLDLAYTACGRYDGFWEAGLSRWDVAAGALIVEEAGGTVTDLLGGGSYLDSGDIVAAGRALHPELVAVTREAFGG